MTMEVNKWKKKKEKYRLEGNLSSVYFCCKELAEIYFNAEKFDDALSEYTEMKQISKDSGNKLDVGRADRMIGEVYCEKGEFRKAIIHQKKHLAVSREEQDKVEEQRALATLGRTFFLQAESIADAGSDTRISALTEAKKFYIKSLEICHELTDENISNKQRMEMTCRLFLNIGLVLDCQNQYEEAINYMSKAVSICKKLDLWEDMYRTYSALGAIYHKHTKKEEALRTYDLALNVAERLSNKTQLACEILIQKADVLLDLPDLRGARQALLRGYKLKPSQDSLKKEIEKKLRTVAAMCEYEEKLTELPPESCFAERKKLYENMGDASAELSNYNLALAYYHLMLECVEKCGNQKEALIECYVSLAQTYKDNNQLTNALKYFKKELELEEEDSPEACKTLLNIGEIYNLLGDTDEMLLIYSKAKAVAFKCSDIKLKKTVLKTFQVALLTSNRASEAEEIKNELNSLGLEVLIESSDDEEETPRLFGADISLENLSDEEAAGGEVPKKAKLSRTRSRAKGNLEKKNEKGETPLHVAAINGNAGLVKKLLEQGHRVDVKDYSGWTPLHEACNHGHEEVVKLLLEHGAPINDRGGAHCDGVTPLLDAASNGSLAVIEILLSHGASPLMRTNRGETVLDCLIGWRERRYEEVGTDLDPITKSHYDSIYSNLKQTLEKTGQKIPLKELSQTNHKYQETSKSLTRNLSSSSLQKNNLTEVKQLHREPESATEDYENTMKSLRRKNSNGKISSSNVSKEILPALLAEEELVGDDWLEDDLNIRPNKKRRTDEFLIGQGIRERKRNVSPTYSENSSPGRNENMDIIDDSSNETDRDSITSCLSEGRPSSTEIERNKNSTVPQSYRERMKEIFSEKKKQTSLLSSGIIKKKASKPESSGISYSHAVNDMTALTTPSFTCMKVRIEDKTIVVPISQSNYESLTISWLEKEAAERYRKLEGSEPLLRLEMEDGGILVGTDPLVILMGVPQIRARVTSWKALSLTGLYKEACETSNVKLDRSLNDVLEAGQATGSFSIEDMYLEHKQLGPLLHTISNHASMQYLSLAGNNIGDNFVTEIAECIAKLPHLRLLDLSSINISNKGLEIISQTVKKSGSLQRLEKLKLGYNPLDDCLRPLSELLSQIPHLRYLSLPSIGLTSHSFNTFVEFTLESLEVLDLSYNDLGTNGLSDFLGRLDVHTIADLRLAATGPQTVREIAFYLQHNTPLSLHALDLSYCPMVQVEAEELIKGVIECKHLEKLSLDGVRDVSVSLASVSLKELSVCGVKLNTAESLPDSLQKLSFTSFGNDLFPINKGPYGFTTLSSQS